MNRFQQERCETWPCGDGWRRRHDKDLVGGEWINAMGEGFLLVLDLVRILQCDGISDCIIVCIYVCLGIMVS